MPFLVLVLALLCSCSLLTPFDPEALYPRDDGGGGDGGVDSGDSAVGADAAYDGEAGPAEPGSMTLVVEELEVVTDRFCDLDGDGLGDNVVADLTSTMATVFLGAFNTTITGLIEERDERVVVHFPWLDDVNGPNDASTWLAVATGYAADWPGDSSDDFAGAAQYYAYYDSVDGCGEPLYALLDVSIEGGAVDATNGSLAVPTVAPFRGASLWGTIARGGAEADLEACGVVLIREIGAREGLLETSHLSSLEVVIAGGAALGLPMVPGLEPDLDMDGDGLERIELDSANHIVSCVDGDNTVIPGGDCWADERMADGFSMNVRLHAVSAELLGPAPFLNSPGGAGCTDPPSEGLWGQCSLAEERACSSGEARACTTECDAAGVERCTWDCRGWLPCGLESSTTQTFVACDGVRLHGWDRSGGTEDEQPATCASGIVELINGSGQVRGASLSEPVVVGQGMVAITGLVSTFCADPFDEDSADGWAVVAYVDGVDAFGEEPFVGTGGDGEVGVNRERRGYSLEWRFTDLREPLSPIFEHDYIALRPVDGSGASWRDVDGFCAQYHCEFLALRTLDVDEPDEPENQGIRLLLKPDDPSTPHVNEQAVSGEVTWGRGAEGERTFLGCSGDGCPVPIVPGTVLQVGVTSASDENGARVVVQAGGLSAEVHRPCE